MENIKNNNEAILFAQWIAEKMAKDSWFNYNPMTKTWFIHMKNRVTTEQLYDIWKNTTDVNTLAFLIRKGSEIATKIINNDTKRKS